MFGHRDVDIHSLDDRNRGLLHVATIRNHIDIVELLLDEELSVSAKDTKERITLYNASREYAFEIIGLLLNKYADASLKDKAEGGVDYCSAIRLQEVS